MPQLLLSLENLFMKLQTMKCHVRNMLCQLASVMTQQQPLGRPHVQATAAAAGIGSGRHGMRPQARGCVTDWRRRVPKHWYNAVQCHAGLPYAI